MWEDENDDSGAEVDDRITEAILGDSVYERLRVERRGFLSQPIPRKLAVQSVLLGALTFVLPITAAFPAPVTALFSAGDPAAASPRVVLLGALALVLVSATGVVLATLEYVRLQFESRLTHAQIEAMLNWEDLVSLFGIGTGGVAVLTTDGLALLGLGGLELVRTYTQSAFTASGTGLSVVVLAVGSLCCAVGLYLASQYLSLVGSLREC